MKDRWRSLIFVFASGTENQSPLSISGKPWILPDFGGHSRSNVLLLMVAVSNSPSHAQASTFFPDFNLIGDNSVNLPSRSTPVSSWNSRRAAVKGSSSSLNSPFGIDQ